MTLTVNSDFGYKVPVPISRSHFPKKICCLLTVVC